MQYDEHFRSNQPHLVHTTPQPVHRKQALSDKQIAPPATAGRFASTLASERLRPIAVMRRHEYEGVRPPGTTIPASAATAAGRAMKSRITRLSTTRSGRVSNFDELPNFRLDRSSGTANRRPRTRGRSSTTNRRPAPRASTSTVSDNKTCSLQESKAKGGLFQQSYDSNDGSATAASKHIAHAPNCKNSFSCSAASSA
jgi:hypothetical protein